MTLDVEGIRQSKGTPKEVWLDYVKDDMERFGLSREIAQFRSEWRMRIKEATG